MRYFFSKDQEHQPSKRRDESFQRDKQRFVETEKKLAEIDQKLEQMGCDLKKDAK